MRPEYSQPWRYPNRGGTRAVRPRNFAWSSVKAERSGFSGTIFTGVTPIIRVVSPTRPTDRALGALALASEHSIRAF